MVRHPRLICIGDWLIGLTFLVAAVLKLWPGKDPATIWGAFERNHARVAIAVVAMELIVGIMLMTGALKQVARAAAMMMLAAFSIVLVRELMQAAPKACGCFGALTASTTEPRVALATSLGWNALLLVLCLAAWCASPPPARLHAVE